MKDGHVVLMVIKKQIINQNMHGALYRHIIIHKVMQYCPSRTPEVSKDKEDASFD